MRTLLEEFWYGNVNPQEQSTENNPDIKHLLNLMIRNRDSLSDTLNLLSTVALQKFQSARINQKNVTLDCTLEEVAVLNFLRENPTATQKIIALHIGKSERTVKSITVELNNKGLLERKNGKRNGVWVVK